MRYSPREGRIRARVVVVVVAGILFGIWAEWEQDRFVRPAVWVPDLAVGVCLIALGGALYPRSHVRRQAELLLLAAGSWFLPNFAGSSVSVSESVAVTRLVFIALVILHAILGLPTGQLRGRRSRAMVILGYAMAIVLTPGTPSSIIAVGLFATLATVVVSADGLLRGEMRIAGICFGIVVVASAWRARRWRWRARG